MALLNKLFKRQVSSSNPNTKSNNQQCRKKDSTQKASELKTCIPEQPKYIDGHHILTKDDVKLVIVKHHDQYGSRVLFDSSNQPQQNSYQDFMFGSSLIPSKSTFTKIHVLNNPPELMFSHIFTPHHKTNNNKTAECGVFDFYGFHELPQQDHTYNHFSSLPISINDDLHKSTDTFSRRKGEGWGDDGDNDRGHEVLSSSLASPGNVFRSVECSYRRSTESKCKMDSQFLQSLPLKKRPLKMGFAIVFRLSNHTQATQNIRDFFFTHLHTLTSTIEKVKLVVCDKAFIEKLISLPPELHHDFFRLHTDCIIKEVMNFYSFPRLQDPVWLTSSLLSPINSSSSPFPSSLTSSQQPSSFVLPSHHLCHSILNPFIKNFVSVCDKCYNRSSKFFFGSLLTATLTHHLSWVSNFLHQQEEEKEEDWDEEVPYMGFRHKKYANPIERELYNLYGTVGFPKCVSKTVIVGKKVAIMKKLLNILSYFIRSSNLYVRTSSKTHENFSNPHRTKTPYSGLSSNSSSTSLDTNLSSTSSDNLSSHASSTLNKSSKNISKSSFYLNELNSSLKTVNTYACLKNDHGCLDSKDSGYSDDACHEKKVKQTNTKSNSIFYVETPSGIKDFSPKEKKKEIYLKKEKLNEIAKKKGNMIEKSKLRDQWVVCVDDGASKTVNEREVVRNVRSEYFVEKNKSSKDEHLGMIKTTSAECDDIYLQTSSYFKMNEIKKSADEKEEANSLQSHPETSPKDDTCRTRDVLVEGTKTRRTLSPVSISTTPVIGRSSESLNTLTGLSVLVDSFPPVAHVTDEKRDGPVEILDAQNNSCDTGIFEENKTRENKQSLNFKLEEALDEIMMGEEYQEADVGDITVQQEQSEGFSTSNEKWDVVEDSLDNLLDGPIKIQLDFKFSLISNASQESSTLNKKLSNKISSGAESLSDAESKHDKKHSVHHDDGCEEKVFKRTESALNLGDSRKDDNIFKPPQRKSPIVPQPPPTTSPQKDEKAEAPQKKRGFTFVPMPHDNFFKNESLKLEKHLSAKSQSNPQEVPTRPLRTTASTFYVDFNNHSSNDAVTSSNDNIPSTSKTQKQHNVQASCSEPEVSSKKFTNISNHSFKLLPTNQNITRSLLGGHCTAYTPDFVLHSTTDRSFLTPPFLPLYQDLIASFKMNLVENPIGASLSIVADVDNWSVQLYSCTQDSLCPNSLSSPTTIISSQLILKLIDTLYGLAKFTADPFVWFSIIEEHLEIICLKSRILAEYIRLHGMLCSQSLAHTLGFDVSDLPLLLAVVGVHSPDILLLLNKSKNNEADT